MGQFDHLFEKIPHNKFEPCLDHRRRAQILALLRRGFKPSTLAAMYNVNRHTVQTMGRESSPHYRPVRAEYSELGRDAFESKYLEEAIVRQALNLQKGEIEANPGAQRPDPVKPTLYNRRASSRAGTHTCEDANGIEITFDIAWRRGDLDGSPEAWFHKEAGFEAWAGPYFTSASAYDGIRRSMTQEQLDAA